QRARERVRAAEQDLGVGDALLGARRRRDHHDEGEQRKEPSGSHGRSPCSGVREPGAIGGWPETRRAPAPVPLPPLIPVHPVSPAAPATEPGTDPRPPRMIIATKSTDRNTSKASGERKPTTKAKSPPATPV